jgi:nucleoid-associated protein YgaU
MHVVIERDPPNDVPGMATVVLDPTASSIRLQAIPELGRLLADAGSAEPGRRCSTEAQLDIRAFASREPGTCRADPW